MRLLFNLLLSLFLPTHKSLPAPKIFTPPTPTPVVITLIATGDVLPARTINARSEELHDYTWPWQATKDLLSGADIVFINLETPLLDGCPIIRSGTVFCGKGAAVTGLKSAGVDVANLANNHINNFGQKGIDSTIQILESHGIKTVGIKNPAIITVHGTKFAFLGFNAVPLSTSLQSITAQIKSAKENVDFVIVQFHWGNEYTTKISDQQAQLAHLAIDSGADLVIGNHPHWVQPEEVYKGKIIKYALGNFIFDQFWSAETLKGELGEFKISNHQVINHRYLPISIDQFGQPHLTNTK
jgi:gamma-polyglutamate biosynthesis protein CapA